MKMREAIEQYILWRRAHGAKFTNGASLLHQFLGHADGAAECLLAACAHAPTPLQDDGGS